MQQGQREGSSIRSTAPSSGDLWLVLVQCASTAVQNLSPLSKKRNGEVGEVPKAGEKMASKDRAPSAEGSAPFALL